MPLKTPHLVILLFAALLFFSCKTEIIANDEDNKTEEPKAPPCFSKNNGQPSTKRPDGNFEAYHSKSAIAIDACAKEEAWSGATWFDLNYTWMGNAVDTSDYKGRFKLLWDSLHLYILVEITDEFLNETLADGQENYWKGDYVEVFIDEDQSGGDHKFNHQAFAYHVSTEGHAIDKNTKQETVFFDSHVAVARSQKGNRYLWEMAILLFDKNFDENATNNKPVPIYNQKKIGFSLAYGDNDGKSARENFMGSKQNHGTNNDDGYINADVFGSIEFLQ